MLIFQRFYWHAIPYCSALIWIKEPDVEPDTFSTMFVDYFQLFYDLGMVWASENLA